MNLNKILTNLAILFCFIIPISLHADFPVPAANLSGTYTNTQQGDTMFLNWNITSNGSSYTYVYNISGGSGGGGGITPPGGSVNTNQLLVQVDPSYTSLNLNSLITNLTAGVNVSITTRQAFGQPILTYLNFTNAANVVRFDTLSAPVWGSFILSNSGGGLGRNSRNGIPVTAATANINNYVPTVGAMVITPEPSMWLLMGSSLLLAGVILQRKTRKSQA